MSNKDLKGQNSKETTYYGIMMVISFLTYYIINRLLKYNTDLPQFLSRFAVALFVVSSTLTLKKYFKARNESQSSLKSKGLLFAIIAALFWIIFLFDLSKGFLAMLSELS